MEGPLPGGRNTRLATITFLFPLAALLCQLQYETSRRPEVEPVLERYLSSELPSVFTSRILPRAGITAIHGLGGGHISHEHANALLQLVCIWGALSLIFELAHHYLALIPALGATFLAALYTIWGFVGTAGYYAYPYDFPALLFSAAGLLAIATRRIAWLFLVVLLGTMNKETIVWLVPAFFFVCARGGVPLRGLLLKTALLLLLFAVAYELPRVLLSPTHALQVTVQATGPTTPRYLGNLRDLLFLNQRNIFTNVWYPFALHAPAVLCFARLHVDLRRMYWAAPILLVPVFFFGNVSEARLYNEIVPLGAVAAMYVFARAWDSPGTRQVASRAKDVAPPTGSI